MGKTAIYSQKEVSNYNLCLLYKYQIVPLSDQNFKHNDYDMTNPGEKPEIKHFMKRLWKPVQSNRILTIPYSILPNSEIQKYLLNPRIGTEFG